MKYLLDTKNYDRINIDKKPDDAGIQNIVKIWEFLKANKTYLSLLFLILLLFLFIMK